MHRTLLLGTLTALLAADLAAAPTPAAAQVPAGPAVRVVGPGEAYATVGNALAAAVDGDTVIVRPGVYRERPQVTRRVVLRGDPGATLDGGGEGTVLTVRAPSTISGLTIRGSGDDQSREDAGILVLEADSVRVVGNRLEDVLFGIYYKQSRSPLVRDNTIVGKPLPIPRRGDGIRLWYCEGGRLAGNRVERTRDVVIWFSSGLLVDDNRVSDGRYGLHYMYSDNNRFENNEFRNNNVGAFLMYSADIRFRGNRFLEAYGATGMGLGLKDADRIEAEENVFAGNSVGIYLDNAPTSVDATNRFRGNLIAGNDIGISLLPAVRGNALEENALVNNLTPVAVTGGGDALANRWTGNYWSEYVGFDEDRDGVGDTPYRHERLADEMYARHPELRLFLLSPAADALELLGRAFPLLRPQPVVIDSAPRLRAPVAEAAVAAPASRAPPPSAGPASAPSAVPTRIAAGGFLLLALAAVALMLRAGRPGRRVA